MTPLQAAIEYASRGWHIFPVYEIKPTGICACGKEDCARPGKHPRTRHGVKDATIDGKVIRSWWSTWPEANIGVACGPISGLLVIDIDETRGRDLLEDKGDIPDTVTQHTGGGGEQLLFRHPDNHKIKNSVRPFPGVDIRAEGGYIIVPPSIHAAGSLYEWDDFLGLDTSLADPPAWLLELLPAKGSAKSKPKPEADELLTAGTKEGHRNDDLFRYGCQLINKGNTTAEIRTLVSIAAKRSTPPLSDQETAKIIESVERYRVQPDDEPPIPLDHYHLANVSEFPKEALVSADPLLDEWVKNVAEVRQVPVDLPAMLTLAVLAALTSKRVKVQIGGSHAVHTNLFTAIAMSPGSRKSTVLDDIKAPLEAIEREEIERTKNQRSQDQARYDATQMQVKALKAKASKTTTADHRDAILAEAHILDQSVREPPGPPQLIIGGDTSIETIPIMLAKLPDERLALFDDEGGIFELLSGLYNAGRANIDIFLKAWSGSTHRVNRVGRDPINLKEPLLTVGITVQPSVIEELAEKGGFRGRGLLGRFAYSIPRSKVGTRFYREKGLNPDLRHAWHALVRDLYSLLPDTGGCQVVALTGPSLALWKDFSDKVERQQAPGQDLEHMTDWASKLAGVVAGIAGVLHCVRHRDGDPWGYAIEEEVITAAWSVGEYLIDHARAAFGMMTVAPEAKLALEILEWAREHRIEEFSLRDLQRRFRSVKRQREFLSSVELLAERGYLESVKFKSPQMGRSKGRSYRLLSISRKPLGQKS